MSPTCLVVAPLTLVEPPNGGTLRTWAAATTLCEVGETVVVAPTGSTLPAGARAELVTAGPSRPGRSRRAIAHIAPGPVEGRVARMALGKAITSLLRDRAVDFALLEHSAAGWAFGDRLASARVPWALNLHNVEEHRAHVAVAETLRMSKRATRTLNAAWTKRAERSAIVRATAVIVVSEEDRRHARDIGARRVLLCPNGVNPELLQLGPAPNPDGWLFIGDLGYGPNIRGLRWFAEEVMPKLPRDSGRLIRIAGRRPTDELRSWAQRTPGVMLVPNPSDLRPLLARSAYCFNPTREGAGTSLKVIEYAAAARPIVSTTLGVRGMPFRDLVAVADEPEVFAESMTALESDPVSAGITGALLRERARAATWERTQAPLKALAHELVDA